MFRILFLLTLIFVASCNDLLDSTTTATNAENFSSGSSNNSEIAINLEADPSSAAAVISTQVLTVFSYKKTQVYVYGALSNENENRLTPQKWIFYFVPIMTPDNMENSADPWAYVVGNELRVKLMLSNDDVEKMAKNAIIRKYDSSISKYAEFWDVVPLMIEKLSAYVVRGTNTPVYGVAPYNAMHVNQLAPVFRFGCSSEETANETLNGIIEGKYEIEIAFYFAGFKQVTNNIILITAENLHSVLSKTKADGGNINAMYIHKRQSSSFISKYFNSIKKIIYTKNKDTTMYTATSDLEDQLSLLMQQNINNLKEVKLNISYYKELWSAKDFHPNSIMHSINTLFIFNETATQNYNFSDTYFNLNKAYTNLGAKSMYTTEKIDLFEGSGRSFSESDSSSNSLLESLITVNKAVYSSKDVRDLLKKETIETIWNGEQWVLKSVDVYKLSDICNYLQVAIIAAQLVADKSNGAIIRTIGYSGPNKVFNTRASIMVGTIQMYAGNSMPAYPWLLCNGTAISRTTFRQLFEVIGISYGSGDGSTTFNLPDFRGRVAIGVDSVGVRILNARTMGSSGGAARQQLTIDQMPSHIHNKGSISTGAAGGHNHHLHDPGHNHAGKTSNSYRKRREGDSQFTRRRPFPRPTPRPTPRPIIQSHYHEIPVGHASIQIHGVGDHTHPTYGDTGSTGNNQPFDIIPPYQTVSYIIYSG